MDRADFLRAEADWLDPDLYDGWVPEEADVEDAPICEHCQAQGAEEHNGGCPNDEPHPIPADIARALRLILGE